MITGLSTSAITVTNIHQRFAYQMAAKISWHRYAMITTLAALFYQLFTAFVQHADHSFPMMYALMTRKTTALYQVVYEMLHELLPDFQPNLVVIADIQEAPATAIRAVFGNAVMHTVGTSVVLFQGTAIVLPVLNDIAVLVRLCLKFG